MDTLEFVDTWLAENRASLEAKGVKIALVRSPPGYPKPFVRVDLETASRLGRVTLWAPGDCQIELLDGERGVTIRDEYVEVRSRADLEEGLRGYLAQLVAGNQ